MEVPLTCQQSTFDAVQELKDFLSDLSEEITYEDWLAGELEGCCDDLVVELNALTDPSRLDAVNAAQDGLLADLAVLRANEGESAEEFAARM